MKKILILLFGILVMSCNQTKKKEQGQESAETQIERNNKTENFDWLLGKWKRLNEKEGKETFENWNKISASEYSGIGFTMQNGDTIKREKVSLTKVDNDWNLAVEVLEEPEPTIFKMEKFSETEFTCINDSIDFPNKITYWKEAGKLKAKVSNSEFEIPFEFEKIE